MAVQFAGLTALERGLIMAFCRNCGKVIEENERFCRSCGQQVVGDVSAPAQKKSTKQTTLILSIVGGVLAVGLAVFLFIYLGGKKETARGNSSGNIVNGGLVALQEGLIYFQNSADNHKIYKVQPDGDYETKVSDDRGAYLNVLGQWLYYANGDDNNRIYRVSTDGSRAAPVNDEAASCVNVVDRWVYYINEDDGSRPYKIRTDGKKQLRLSDDQAADLSVVDGWAYYTNRDDGGKIYKVRVNGSKRTQVNDEASGSPNVVGKSIYYVNEDDQSKIYKIGIDGSGKTAIGDDAAACLNVANNWVYYSNKDDDAKAYRISTNGGEPTQISDEPSGYLNVAGDWLYYADLKQDGKIVLARVRTDGSSVKGEEDEGEDEEKKEDPGDKPDKSADESSTAPPTHFDDPALKYLGLSKKEMLSRYGKPEGSDSYMGGVFFSYREKEGLLFFFPFDHDDDSLVSSVWITRGEIMGVTIGAPFSEIIAAWGEPESTDYNEAETQSWFLRYLFPVKAKGGSQIWVNFEAQEKNGPTSHVMLKWN